MSEPRRIDAAVGRRPALNYVKDQQTIITLLHRVLPADGGPGSILPAPSKPGLASSELINAIVNFQNRNVPARYRDGRVDPKGFTLRKLNELARSSFPVEPPQFPPEPPPFPPQEADFAVKVRQHINRALSAFSSQREFDRLWSAAGLLKNERNKKGKDGKPQNCGDRALACAEHYMIARAFVASGGGGIGGRTALFAIAMAGIALYDVGKLVVALQAALQSTLLPFEVVTKIRRALAGLIYELGDCPMSDGPPDPTSTAWGTQGARDGLTPLR